MWREFRLLALIAIGTCVAAAQPLRRPRLRHPAFMTMKGLPLSCFAKSNFEQDGLEFFVCNGGGGIAGVRKKNDAKHTIFVRDPDIAQNLNLQVARGECTDRVSVSADRDGFISFRCGGSEMAHTERFQRGIEGRLDRLEQIPEQVNNYARDINQRIAAEATSGGSVCFPSNSR